MSYSYGDAGLATHDASGVTNSTTTWSYNNLGQPATWIDSVGGSTSRKVDLYVRDRLYSQDFFVEVKTGPTARPNPRQEEAFPIIESQGFYGYGARAEEAGFPSGEFQRGRAVLVVNLQ